MVYLKIYPRPMGPEPKIYLERPQEAESDPIEVEPGCFLEDPWSLYDIAEFENEFAARKWLKENYPFTYLELKQTKF